MKAIVKKWGNSAAVRIPASVLAAANLQLDQLVDISENNGLVVIEPVRQKAYSLEELVAEITPENSHDSENFGVRVGKEAW